ncbi:Glutamate receptor ionotropic, delta-2-like 25 [Homarus americanus]|uniref:Glutamate receptor ionotropic, delta-2-like 25 n=1 Tax=Homarus americanus TaxID=6706 RepID=A0A8J5J7L0_HOMAM|nr:Glutamate receptor ionotropic, delta-2-like 25 [Homarus americanus]
MILIFLVTLLPVTHPVLGFLVNTTSSLSFGVEALYTVLRGPLADWGVVLYRDPDLEVKVLDQLLALPALQDSPRVLVDLGSDGDLWSKDQPAPVLRGARVIHIVVFKEDPRPFFEAISLQWNPKYLMLFSLADESVQTLLMDNVFKGIERLVLFENPTPLFQKRRAKARLYTSLPFSKVQPVIALGDWNPTTFRNSEDIFVDRYQSFEGYEFLLGTWLDDRPYLYQSATKAKGVGDGVVAEMLDAMAGVLDYRYNVTTVSPDEQWGSYENGSWNGMLGMVHRGEKNFTVNYFVITEERLEAFDASVSYRMEGFGLAMMIPAPLAKWRATYYPFMPSVWFCVGGTFAIVVVIMTLQDLLQPEPFLGGLGQTWPYLLRAVVNHSLPVLPTAQWQRVLVGVWWVYCFILTTAYTANLIAFLTIPVFPKRIQTLEELAQSDYRVSMCDYGEFVPGALKTSENRVYRALGDKLDLFKEYEEIIPLMRRGTHAFIESYSYGRLLLYADFEIKMEDFLGQDYERRERLAAKEQLDNKQPLSLQHLQGVFFILLLSWAASVVVFTIELVLLQVLQ